MSSIKKFALWLVGFFGSILMLIGFLFFFAGLIVNNMAANVDNFDQITKASMKNFIDANKVEVREFVEDRLKAEMGEFQFTKEQFIVACQMKGVQMAEGNGAIEFQKILQDSEICDNADAKSEDQIKDDMIAAMAGQNIDKIMDSMQQTNEVKGALQQMKTVFDSYKGQIFIGAVIIFLLGVFLVFAGSSFKWKKAAYSVCFQMWLKLLTVGIAFLYIKALTPDRIMGIIDALKSQVPQLAETANVPPLFMKLGAEVILNLLRLGTNPLILASFIAAIPFLGGFICLLIQKIKEKKQGKAKAEVV